MKLRTLLALPALTCLVLAGCQREPKAADWDLVVVVLDALPADHLGLFGYQPEGSETLISPEIDAFAAGHRGHTALNFTAAFASASYTLASTASLFTGTSPATHGVLGLDSNVLSKNHLTLAEAFKRAGFATCALSSNPNISTEGQFDQGFDTFRHYFRDKFERHSLPANLIPDAGAWWQHHADQRRLLYAHLLPPHQPYDPPAPHDQLFGASEVPRDEGLTPELTQLSKRRDLTTSSPEVQRIRRRYDAGVHYADALFGELLETLAGPDGHGLDQTVIVLTSDHGEAFAQHGVILHGAGVFDELAHVPLVMAFPADAEAPSGTYPHVVSTEDLAPTLAELFDIAFPGEAKAPSFWSAVRSSRPTGRAVLTRSAGDRPLWSLRTDAATLIDHRASKTTLLFDREADPGEQANRATAEPGLTGELRSALGERLKAARTAAKDFPRASTPELVHKDALEELGYFGD